MRRYRILMLSAMLACAAFSAPAQQKNVLTLSGGYSFADIEDYDTSATGWRINALYELNPTGDPVAHGVAAGFMSLTAQGPAVLPGTLQTEYTISSLPVYYSGKFMFGGESFKAFIKGAIGIQFSWLTRTGGLGSIEVNDIGFYGGGGAGIMLMLSETMFVNAEYEGAYLANSYYKDGFVHTAMGGVGFRF